MPQFSSMVGKFRARNSGLHDPTAARIVKRPRDSLVCNHCKALKIRCDRMQPCRNCVNRDNSAGCKYQQAIGSGNDSNRQEAAEDRLIHLESLVKGLMRDRALKHSDDAKTSTDLLKSSTSPRQAQDSDQTCEQDDGATYVGFTHWSAILDDINELKSTLGNHAYIRECSRLATTAVPSLGGEVIFGSSTVYSLHQVVSQHLPGRVQVDRLLAICFRGENFIVPFIHTIHFNRQYQDFWSNTTNVNPLWLSMLFSICCVACFIKGTTGSHLSSKDDLLVETSLLHEAAGKCLVLGNYHKPQQYAPEALALYAQSKNLRSLDPCREAGAIFNIIVHMAYEMGYHRDPDLYGSFTVFEGEMRRRFWSACKQMDLMLAFQLGLPSNITLEDCDTKTPSNLLDSDFDIDTEVLPLSRSDEEPTQLLWFIVKDRQMTLFSKVCQDALSFKEKSEAEIFELDSEIRQMHDTIPAVLRMRPLSDSIADAPSLIVTRRYIEALYLKCLVVLHRRYMTRGDKISTRCCIEASKRLVNQTIEMHEEFSPGGQLHTARWMFTNFTLNDFLLGIMVLCLAFHTRQKQDPRDASNGPFAKRELYDLLEQSLTICIEYSAESTGALRVSRAIRLTLDAASLGRDLAHATTPTQHLASSTPDLDSPSQGSDPLALSLLSQEWHDETSKSLFGMFDPFNFIGNDFEDVDWTESMQSFD